ncbi:MAG: hypothetical protein HUU47_05260 [Bacteroidetes bacterium]|nr:hypothetical protein [Bacteroidota bacterium]
MNFIILLIFVFSINLGFSQFGPKKKELKSKIDTLEMLLKVQKSEINNLQFRDSLSFSEIKRLSSEMKDIKQYVIDLNNELIVLKNLNQSVTEENQKLKKLYEQLIKKVEIHQILIRNVIGGDSLEIFEKQIEKEKNEKNKINTNLKTQNFNNFALEFISKLKKDGEKSLKEYISDSTNLFYLSKPGFITAVVKINDISEFAEEIPWKIALESFKKSNFSFIEGEKPEINCDMADLYNKRGCYGGIEENFNKISKSIEDLKEFSPEEEIPLMNEINEIKELEKTIIAFIYSTDGNLGFYFIKHNETWKLVCLEIEDPCST